MEVLESFTTRVYVSYGKKSKLPVAFLFRSDVRGVSGLAGGVPSDCDPEGVVVVVVTDPSELWSRRPPSEELCDVDGSNGIVLGSRGWADLNK